VRAFRFRAAGVLELRRKQEDDAKAALAHAENARREADARVGDAESRVAEAMLALAAVQRPGAPGWLLGWHRSWISRQGLEADARRREASAAREATGRAEVALREAHKKRRVLERLHDRLARKHLLEMGRLDLREMNALAGVRFQTRTAAEREEQHDDRSDPVRGDAPHGDDD